MAQVVVSGSNDAAEIGPAADATPDGELRVRPNPDFRAAAESICDSDENHQGNAPEAADAVTTFQPLFMVVSIRYSPPGDRSSQTYASVSSTGTTTLIRSNFAFADILSKGRTTTAAIPAWQDGYLENSASAGDAEAFTQTLVAGSARPGRAAAVFPGPPPTNSIDHNRDVFEVWLNPVVAVHSRGAKPTCFSLTFQPPSSNTEPQQLADIVRVPALAMEASAPGVTALNPTGESGVSTVPLDLLVPQAVTQADSRKAYLPGLGAICANNELYRQQLAADMAVPNDPAEICTQENQCGCTPADFSDILLTDPLLNYDETTYTAQPLAGTVSPLRADSRPTSSGPGSGPFVCSLSPVPFSANCRYVVVPRAATGVEALPKVADPMQVHLSGEHDTTIRLSDRAAAARQLAGSSADAVPGVVTDGPLAAEISTPSNWTWTKLESVGSSGDHQNVMALKLATSIQSCQQDINVYEDTVYHTFVFQVPEQSPNCAARQSISFPPPGSPVALSDSPILLSATASSGLPVDFRVVSGPGSVSGNRLALKEAGTVVIVATQTGNSTYAPAVPIQQSITATSDPPSFLVRTVQDNLAQTALSLGHSMSYTITVSPIGGFSGPVRLGLSGLPLGISYAITPVVVWTPGKATLRLTSAYSASTYIGDATLTVTGVNGRLTSSGSFTLLTRRLQYKSACHIQ